MKQSNQIKTLLDYFGIKQLWDIHWSHRINNRQRLNSFIKSEKSMMLEGDIYLSEDGNNIMAHPPVITSVLTFEDWISKIANSSKGAKLDFKKNEIVTSVLKKLRDVNPQVPIILHADVLPGPGDSLPVISAYPFVRKCVKYFPNSILSIGWQTDYVPNGKYTDDMIKEMTDLLKSIDKKQTVTINIRACYMKKLPQTFINIIKQNPNHFFTLWNAPDDPPLPNNLKKWIQRHIGLRQLFYDLIDKRINPLNL